MESNPFLLIRRDDSSSVLGCLFWNKASSFLVLLRAAQVSLELVVIIRSDSWRSPSNSLLDLTSALFVFEVRGGKRRSALCRVVG